MNYWCTPQEKSDYIGLLSKNEKKKEKERREKYNPDNIFKDFNESKEDTIQHNVSVIKYKETLLNRIINKIKNIFYDLINKSV